MVAVLIVAVILASVAGIGVFTASHFATKAACATEKDTVGDAEEAYEASTGAEPTNVAELVGGKLALLKSTPTNYTIVGQGNVAPIPHNPAGCR